MEEWKNGDIAYSTLICQAIQMFYKEKNSGSTLDGIMEKERKKEEQNKRIDEFVILVDGINANPSQLEKQYDLDQLKRLNSQTAILNYKIKDAIERKLRKEQEEQQREKRRIKWIAEQKQQQEQKINS